MVFSSLSYIIHVRQTNKDSSAYIAYLMSADIILDTEQIKKYKVLSGVFKLSGKCPLSHWRTSM